MFDVWVAIGFGILGYYMRKKGWPLIPLILGFILGDLFEGALRQTLSMSSGSLKIFYKRPIAGVFILMTVVTLAVMWRYLRRVPKEVLKEDKP
jgi:putative tricarboxylic transport membrane protein